MNFNTDLQLWVNYVKAYPERNLTINEGGVYYNGECLAVFATQLDAVRTIRLAREEAAK